MLFSEVYGAYYNVLARLLEQAVFGQLTRASMYRIIREEGFEESVLTIPEALESGTWPLLREDFTTPLEHKPTMPLTTLQRRWLKALLSDPRIALFEPDTRGLEDVEPLYRPGTFVLYDQYADGDPYGDENYIACFRLILQALREKRMLRIRFRGQSGLRHSLVRIPLQLEYSLKDDKFRLRTLGRQRIHSINLARISSCQLLEAFDPSEISLPAENLCTLTLLLHDKRNALERVLLHFSHFAKETVRLDDQHYQLRLRYDKEDETELLIRVLSFGPVLQVTDPPEFAALVKERLSRQSACFSPGGEG